VNVTVENLAPCKKLLRVEVEAQKVDETFAAITKDVQRKVVLPGFRPGKAPAEIIQRRFDQQIQDEVKRKLISESFKQALREKEIEVLGAPDIEEIQFGRGQPLQFAATLETAPEFTLPEYKGLPVQLEPRAVTEADLERALTVLREQRATFNTVEHPLQTGDFAVVNYTGTCDGKPIIEIAPTAKGLSEQKNFWLEVPSHSFIPGFSDQLLGAKAGDKRTVQVDFPAGFVTPQLAGKKGVYEVELVEIKQKALPPLDEALAQAYGAANLEALRAGVRHDLEKELKSKQDRSIRAQVMAALFARVNFELPETAVARETRNVIDDILVANQKRGISREMIEKEKDQIFSAASHDAQQSIKAAFLLRNIAEKEDIKVSQAEIAERIVHLAKLYQIPPEKFAKDLQARDGMIQVYDQIMNEKVMEFLVQNARIHEVPVGTLPAEAAPNPS